LPGDEPQTVLSEIRDAVGTIDAFKVSVDAGPTMYPSEVKRDAPIVEAMAEAVRVMTGAEPKYSFSHQALDAGYLNFKGIQTICYGAGRYRFAHTNVDIAAVSDVINAAKVYAYLPMSDIH
jgi:di/tripeptidase